MTSATVATVMKMLETLPDAAQEKVADHLRDFIEDLLDEQQWDEQFKTSQNSLIAEARRARQEITEGKSKLMNLDEL